MDCLLGKIQVDISRLAAIDQAEQKAAESSEAVLRVSQASVGRQRIQRELPQTLAAAREFLARVLKDKDRADLLEIFGGDCKRIAQLRVTCESFALAANDDKRQRLIDQITSVERVLKGRGLKEVLRTAQDQQRLEKDNPMFDVADPMASTAVTLSIAKALEKEGDFEAAARSYASAQKQMRLTINVCRAVAKMRRGYKWRSSVEQGDAEKLEDFSDQLQTRIEMLLSVDEGSIPEKCQELLPPALSFHEDPSVRQRIVAACGAAGVAAMCIGPRVALVALVEMSPVGWALAVGATVGMFVAAGWGTAASEDNLKAESEGEVVVER